MHAPNRINVRELNRLVSTPDRPAIDVISVDPDFPDDRYLVSGAFRHLKDDAGGLVARLDGRLATVMCRKEQTSSVGLTAPLPSDGLRSERLDGANVFHRPDRSGSDRMRDVFGLRAPAQDNLATIVRGADPNRHDIAPEAATLLALSVGLSRQYQKASRQLQAVPNLYDALYRWARDGYEEGRDWPASRP